MATWIINEIRKSQGNKACVVFIHGFTGDATLTWGRFPDLLANEPSMSEWDILCFGFESSLAPDMTGIWKGNPEIQMISDSLKTFIKMSFASQYNALVFIAHSMGGLVIQRALLDEASLFQKVDKVILFGTPSFGLTKAWPFQLPLLKKLFRQPSDMAKNSAFIRTLREDWNKRFGQGMPFGFLAVAGSEDEFVPASASINDFPDDQCAVVPGNHLNIVKPISNEDASVNLVLRFISGKRDFRSPLGSAAFALERREFQKVIDTLGNNPEKLDARALVKLALALDGLGKRAESIQVLKNAERKDTDAMGVLAGRHKRIWIENRTDNEGRAALDMYDDAYRIAVGKGDAAQAFYHGINRAFLALMYENDLGKAREIAQEVLTHCAAAKQKETSPASDDSMWRRATEGEANLILGNVAVALERYAIALLGPPKPEPWQLTSSGWQACLIADKLRDAETASSLKKLFYGDKS
jgi:pimeloyl-ACP methyl ester carboxylesterase